MQRVQVGIKASKDQDGTIASVRSLSSHFPSETQGAEVLQPKVRDTDGGEKVSEKVCRGCEGELRIVKGKLVCMKLGCSMLGLEQGGKR